MAIPVLEFLLDPVVYLDDPRAVGGLPSEIISGYSDLGRQATNPQWQYPTVFNPLSAQP